MAQENPLYARDNLRYDEAGVVWCAVDVTDDLVYTMTSVTNPDDVQKGIDDEYDRMADDEATAGGDPGKRPNYGCWLKEDWAALPAVAA